MMSTLRRYYCPQWICHYFSKTSRSSADQRNLPALQLFEDSPSPLDSATGTDKPHVIPHGMPDEDEILLYQGGIRLPNGALPRPHIRQVKIALSDLLAIRLGSEPRGCISESRSPRVSKGIRNSSNRKAWTVSGP